MYVFFYHIFNFPKMSVSHKALVHDMIYLCHKDLYLYAEHKNSSLLSVGVEGKMPHDYAKLLLYMDNYQLFAKCQKF